MAECRRRGDIVAVPPRLEIAAVDFLVVHASAKLYLAQATKTAGWTAARAERTKVESGCTPKGELVRWAMQLVSMTVQPGNAEMYRWIGLIISR